MPRMDSFLNVSERVNFPVIDNCGQLQIWDDFHKELHYISQTCLVEGSVVHIQTSCLGVSHQKNWKLFFFFLETILLKLFFVVRYLDFYQITNALFFFIWFISLIILPSWFRNRICKHIIFCEIFQILVNILLFCTNSPFYDFMNEACLRVT